MQDLLFPQYQAKSKREVKNILQLVGDRQPTKKSNKHKLYENRLHPCHLQKVQHLQSKDYPRRVDK